jgi:mannose-1-phosphate guanylyltransferase
MEPIDLSDVYITILAGGSGTRLWPLSRKANPKQVLPLVGDRSLLRRTVDRICPLVRPEQVFVLTGPEHAEGIAQQAPAIPQENIWIEPSPKGTAPALGLAAMRLAQRGGGQSVMVSVHADHMVKDEEAFRNSIRAAVATARRGFLVTVGIVPTHPETGFGYIERGEVLSQEQGIDVYRVSRFTEKPALPQAQEFVASGSYYWNSGYFTWTLDHILMEYERLLPNLYAQIDIIGTADDIDSPRIQGIWEQIEPVTIDRGIMEHARHVAVVPAEMGWSDVGSWAALYDVLSQDSLGNAAAGPGEHVAIGTRNTLVQAHSGRLIATIGVENLVIVDTGDALLVMDRERAQEVGVLVDRLRSEGRDALL